MPIRSRSIAALIAILCTTGTAAADPGATVSFWDQIKEGLGPPTAGHAPVPGAAKAFEALIQQLPAERPSGRPVGEIALLGIGAPSGWEGHVQAWLMPRALDRVRLEADLLTALHARRSDAILIAPGGRSGAAGELLDFSAGRPSIARANAGLGVDALLAVKVSQTWDWPGELVVEARLYGGRSEAGAYTYPARIELPGGVEGYGDWNVKAAGLAVALLLLLLISRAGRSGVLVISLTEQEVDASVVYTAYVTRGKLDDRDDKNVVLRRRIESGETELRRLPTQELRVTVRRVERSIENHQVRSNEIVERAVTLRSGSKATARFDFGAKGVPASVTLIQGKRGAATGAASIAVEGRPETARFMRDGEGSISLTPGAHTLLVGYEDRAFRVPVRIQHKAREAAITVDVDNVEKAFFNGCPDAVTPYVSGDLAAAAVALEAAGHSAPAALLRAEVHRAKGEAGEAARVLESAGQLREAARVRASAGDSEGTAELLERAQDWRGAGRQHKNAGNLAAAARAFAQGQHWDEALECAFGSGDRMVAIDVLEAKGDRLQAAQVCLELDDVERATVVLQRVSLSDPQYGESCLLLAEMFNGRDEPELALQKLDEAVGVFGSEASLELREQIARALEAKGNIALALECFEHIRKRDINYPGASEEIDQLRARLTQPSDGGGATVVRDSAAAPPGQSDRYALEEEIGRGGMGVVFRARDRVLGREVAYKRLPENLKQHEEAVKFFVREARSAAALNHPNIVTLYDAGQDGDVYYLTMELLEGRPMNEVLQKMKRLDVRNSLKVAIQVAEGLAYAHGQNIVHRDIKPSNLFLTKSSRIKIMDFGLAKMVEEVRRKTTLIAGTPHYMAPEQASGEAVDTRADLYAFGVTLYELIAGNVPFPKGDATYHRMHTPAPNLRDTVAETPAELARLVMDLMAKAPADRPSTAGATARLKSILRSLS